MEENEKEELDNIGPDDLESVEGSVTLEEPVTEPVTEPLLPPPIPPVTREMVNAAGPAKPGLWAAALYALCTLALGYPALAGKFLAGPNSDQFVAGYAFREFGAAMLKATGGFAQWNPFLFGGMPYIAAMHGDIFYPTFLMRMIRQNDAAMSGSLNVNSILGGLIN
jgi:hypothetical protein